MSEKKRIGELLLEAGYISREQLLQALRIQIDGTRRLGRIFLQMGVISEDQLVEILSKQLNLQIIQVEQAFNPQVKKAIPKYLCRRYSVIPLDFHERVLEVAMSDPSDIDAIRDIEAYTGKAVHPRLARHQDIVRGINKFIPLSFQDMRNPSVSASLGKVVSVFTLVLILLVSVFTYSFYSQERYGSVTRTEETTLYKNHDLMIGYEHAGTVTLLGRGAYSDGYFSVTFNNYEDLLEFIKIRKTDFSEKQLSWIQWTISAKK